MGYKQTDWLSSWSNCWSNTKTSSRVCFGRSCFQFKMVCTTKPCFGLWNEQQTAKNLWSQRFWKTKNNSHESCLWNCFGSFQWLQICIILWGIFKKLIIILLKILLTILLFSESSICLGFKKFQKAIDKSWTRIKDDFKVGMVSNSTKLVGCFVQR